jgi:hypothetical protein
MHQAKRVIASVAAVALFASSTAAVAAAPAPQAPAAQTQAPDAWMMLSVLSPTRAVALGGANAAAQPTNPPPEAPPPPPPEGAGGLAEGWAPVAVIGLWAILIVIALATSGSSGAPNSPG